jgi:transposase-like protein
MGKSAPRDPIYRGRRFSPEVIQQCVRWYVTYRLSYRDLVAIMAEQGVIVSHTTLMRWVLRYVPEYERRWARYSRSPDPSWRMDETAVAVRGGRHYLYRAVDRHGKSVASLLCGDRSIESAQAFFRTAVSVSGTRWPQKINLDGNSATHRAIRLLAQEDDRWGKVEVRARRYLNNVIEQDHRAIKQRCAPMLGLKTRLSAAITLAGIELAHRIRKEQHSLPMNKGRAPGSLKDSWDVALAQHALSAVGHEDLGSTMHQNSSVPLEGSLNAPAIDGHVRYTRKIPFGGSLYLLVRPRGGRYWRYNYRYGGRQKTLSLGTYPDVPTALARSWHRAARRLLAAGVDPSTRRRELRRI